jgi:hypothetical protein
MKKEDRRKKTESDSAMVRVLGIAIAGLMAVSALTSAQPAAAINQEDAQKLTPLIRAAAKGDLKEVDALL